jgi:hypothetical protein
VTVVRVIRQRPGVQHEVAANLDAELVRRAGLTLADELHLQSIEGMRN